MTMTEKREKMKALRIGAINYNRDRQLMVVLDYIDNKNVLVGFNTGGTRIVEWKNFRLGTVIDWMFPSVCGVGCLGVGKYNAKNNTESYGCWSNMIQRCYSDRVHKKQPMYINCTVSEEWHNFQNFAKWYEENYYEIKGERMDLDKDIKIHGNKVYSPDNCLIVPHYINSLFIKGTRNPRGLPIGVSYNNQSKKYQVVFRKDQKLHQLGTRFDTTEEAFAVYKYEKEKHIKEVADRYKENIPEKLYNAMYNYEVEITD